MVQAKDEELELARLQRERESLCRVHEAAGEACKGQVAPDHRGPSKNKRHLKIKVQLQNKRHDVAYFLVYQWIVQLDQLIFEITYTFQKSLDFSVNSPFLTDIA